MSWPNKMTMQRYSDVLLCVQLAVRECIDKKVPKSRRQRFVVRAAVAYGKSFSVTHHEVDQVTGLSLQEVLY